jgi:Uncharacterized protein family UPF0004
MAVEALRLVLSSYTSASTIPGGVLVDSGTSSPETSTGRNATPNDDPFGSIARSISACPLTRQEGGTIGWMEPSSTSSFDTTTTTVSHSSSSPTILPALLVQELYHRQPKAGDMELLHNEKSNQWHLIQVAEVWLDPYLSFAMTTETEKKNNNALAAEPTTSVRIGSYTGSNQLLPPRKLKGKGILPTFLLDDLATYDILTAGCQMNVADSERCTLFCFCRRVSWPFVCSHSLCPRIQYLTLSPLVEGILQNQLSLTRTTTKRTDVVSSSPPRMDTMPDVLVLNTCSIRDHAEQKLYDTLGPYAAAKRNGRQMAVIVTGCVAQQEGERLLRRIPEIDAVLGA